MADVIHLPGLWEQIRLVAALRWRIMRNGMRNKNRVWDLVGVIVTSIFTGLFVLAGCFGFYFATSKILLSAPQFLWLLFWAVFLWWQVIPVFVAGFSPAFSFRTLLRFPLKLSTFYIIGIAYGLADSAALGAILWMASMVLATLTTDVSIFPAMALASGLFVLANVTLERLLGSWTEKILANRRAKEFFLAVFILLCVSTQFIIMTVKKHEAEVKSTGEKILPYLRPLPPSLAASMVRNSVSGDTLGVVKAGGGLCLYGVVFGALLWRRYATQYRGEELSETAAPARASKKAAVVLPATIETGGLEILPAEISAIVRKEMRYLTRNTFVAISLVLPPLLVLLFASQFAVAHPSASRHPFSPQLFFPGVMAYIVLILMAPAFNTFSYEGRGMQTYFMVPVRFRDILLGKNLTQFAVLIFEVAACIGVLAWKNVLPELSVILSTLMALIFCVVGQFTIGNWSSLTFPKKMEFGRAQGQRQSGMAVLIAFATQIVFMGICTPVFFAARWTQNSWLPVEIFAFLAAAAIAGYFASLDTLTQVAERKKERLLETLCK